MAARAYIGREGPCRPLGGATGPLAFFLPGTSLQIWRKKITLRACRPHRATGVVLKYFKTDIYFKILIFLNIKKKKALFFVGPQRSLGPDRGPGLISAYRSRFFSGRVWASQGRFWFRNFTPRFHPSTRHCLIDEQMHARKKDSRMSSKRPKLVVSVMFEYHVSLGSFVDILVYSLSLKKTIRSAFKFYPQKLFV